MPKKPKVPTKELKYLGERIRSARDDCRLTQQEVAEQTSMGLRHFQNIEKGLVNPSYEVLSAIIHRLAMSADILFYPDLSQQEEETRYLLNKFAACTETERQFLLKTVDCMVEQFLRRHHEEATEDSSE